MFRSFLRAGFLGLITLLMGFPPAFAADHRPPNIVIIFCDDLGYGDLGSYGNPTIRTPHLDRMAAEGQKWTSFYSAAEVCTPSRAALLTGRLPIRSGMASNKRRVLFPNSKGGLPADEVTLAETLKARGYATHAIGKWHLGHLPEYLPTSHGFDSYYGIPYSNDMDGTPSAAAIEFRQRMREPKDEYWNVPLMRDTQVIERPAEQSTLTRRYTEQTLQHIKQNKDKPFFLYLAHTMPHVPLFRSSQFAGTSRRGLYGDVIEELDWSVGQVLQTLREEGLDQNTYVFFTSDNGPWLIFDELGGTAGLLRDGKGSTWEGGMRVPFIAWAPGKIKPETIMDMGSTMDLFVTCTQLAGGEVPADRVIDGYDITPVLHGQGPSPRDRMFFYRGTDLFAVRKGPYKAHYLSQNGYGQPQRETHNPALLYNLNVDASEKFDIAPQNAGKLAEIRAIADEHLKTVTPVENQLEK